MSAVTAMVRPVSAVRTPRGIAKMVKRLESGNKDYSLFGRSRSGFTRAQLIAALAMLRSRAPSIEVMHLRPWYRDTSGIEETQILLECSSEDAIALIGRRALPTAPKRVKCIPPWYAEIWRLARGRMRISLDIRPEDVARAPHAPLAAFNAAAIRALAPLSRLRGRAPETREAWKSAMLDDVLFSVDFADSSMIERTLRSPTMHDVHDCITPRGATKEDRETIERLIKASNARFRLPESARAHIVALYGRLHGELRQALLQAIEAAPVEDRAATAGSVMRLAIDNTVY